MIRARHCFTVLICLGAAACSSSKERVSESDAQTQALMQIFGAPQPAPAPRQSDWQEAEKREAEPASETPTSGRSPASGGDPYDQWFGSTAQAQDPGEEASAASRDSAQVRPVAPAQAPDPDAERYRVPRTSYDRLLGERIARDETQAPGTQPESDPFGSLVGTLPPQELEPGTCGMFLWVRRAQPKLVFFGHGEEGSARMTVKGKVTELPRIAASGAGLFGQYARQSFEGRGVRVDVEVDFPASASLTGTVPLRRGRMRLRDDAGWSYVLPVGGLLACQSS